MVGKQVSLLILEQLFHLVLYGQEISVVQFTQETQDSFADIAVSLRGDQYSSLSDMYEILCHVTHSMTTHADPSLVRLRRCS